MRVLWLVNILIPRIAKKMNKDVKHVGGGWLTGISNALLEQPDFELCVCVPDSSINSAKTMEVENNLTCCLFPEKNGIKYSIELKTVFRAILKEIKPDVVHAFGTEYPRALSMAEATEESKIPYIISITGMVGPYSKKYFGSVPDSRINHNPIKELLARRLNTNTLRRGKKDFERRAIYERKTINKCKYVIGRTSWDYACTSIINPQIQYFKCNETLRSAFYEKKWDIRKCVRHSIIVPQLGYPIKGFEVFLEGLFILKQYFSDIKVFVPGWNRFCMPHSIKRSISIWLSDYDSYLRLLINKYDLWNNIEFCGALNEISMRDKMLEANVFVLPSAIENSPNSLGEAMLLGVPTVASCVGGVQDLVRDKDEGFIYPYNEPYMMAHYVKQIFENDSLAVSISNRALHKAEKLYDSEKNMRDMIDIYRTVLDINQLGNE